MKKDKKIKEYDKTDNSFRARIILGPNVEKIVRFKIIKDNLHFDDLYDKAFEIMDKKYPESSYPNANVTDFEVYCSETKEWCQVLAESENEAIKNAKKNSKASRILVLPEYTYHLTEHIAEEYKLFTTLRNQGIIPENEEFDYDKMHKVLEMVNK